MIGFLMAVIGILLAAIFIGFLNTPPVILIIVFGVLGITSQIVYALSLNRFLGGVDPVRYGARSLKQLNTIKRIPLFIKVLKRLVEIFGFAVVFSILVELKIL